MDENAPAHATDDADRSPFRRFPYGPALLCVGCLVMCGYTWMRFSYAWDVTPSHLSEAEDRMRQGRWPSGAWARLHGQVWWQDTGESAWTWFTVADGAASRPVAVFAPRVADFDYPSEFVGRVAHKLAGNMGIGISMPVFVTVDTTASRFHPASIAGLVVGAMGVFVFGLYLRMWVKERREGG